ncbi:MAG: class SAM-dependent methyltransferase [Daejeonella sp.]|nr:class SAM-dependent methyltransferase [Daejeonella sp.]
MSSEFKAVFSDIKWSDDFYRFLQVIFHLYPEDEFHHLIKEKTEQLQTDEEIYKNVQADLPKIKTFLSELTYALPALKKQKKEIARQTLSLVGNRKQINGYMEIGSTGRYISELRKHLQVEEPVYLLNDIAPSNSPGDIMERGQLSKLGNFIDIKQYAPLNSAVIADESLDLITCYIGVHHCPEEKLNPFISSLYKSLRTGGMFIIRDHDVRTPEMAVFVSLVHTVFNLGLNETYEFEKNDYKNFKPADEWSRIISLLGFTDNGNRILQDKDSSDNTLMLFTK